MFPRTWLCPECKQYNNLWPDHGAVCDCGYEWGDER